VKDYKLNKKTAGEIICMFLVGCLGVVLFYFLLTGKLPDTVTLDLDIMIGIACVVMIGVGFGISIGDFFYADFYSKIIYLPMEDLDPQLYDNMLVLSYEGHAWAFTYKFNEIATHPNVRTIMYYTRKKKFKSFKIIPITT
jgi:hypothetical protein